MTRGAFRAWKERSRQASRRNRPVGVFLYGVPLLALVAAVCILALMLVTAVAETLDQLSDTASRDLISKVVDLKAGQLARTTRDYAYWSESFDHLVTRFDPAWADRNIGADLTESFGVQLVLLIGTDDRVREHRVDGSRIAPGTPESATLDPGVLALVDKARRAARPPPEPVTGQIAIGGVPYLAAAAALIPPEDERPDAAVDGRSVLVFAQRVDAQFLEGLQAITGNTDLRIGPPGSAGAGQLELTFVDPRERAIAGVVWQAPRPGGQFLAAAMPAILIVVFGITGVGGILVGRLVTSARVIEQRDIAILEAQAREIEVRRARMSRLDVIGASASVLVHELNQPLTAASAYLAAVAAMPQRDGPAAQATARAAREVERAAAIVRRVRGFARSDPAERRPVEVDGLVLDAVDAEVEAAARRGVSLECRAETAGALVQVDPVQIGQVLANLIRNAVAAVADVDPPLPVARRTVRVRASRIASGRVRLGVEDHGPGIAPERRAELFSPLASDGAGLGLGLAISTWLLNAHDAALNHEAVPGGGTAIWFELSCHER